MTEFSLDVKVLSPQLARLLVTMPMPDLPAMPMYADEVRPIVEEALSRIGIGTEAGALVTVSKWDELEITARVYLRGARPQ